MSNWEPTKKDIEWTKNTIDTLKSEASWIVPVALAIYKIRKLTKKATPVYMDDIIDPPENVKETRRRIELILSKHLGYTIVREPK